MKREIENLIHGEAHFILHSKEHLDLPDGHETSMVRSATPSELRSGSPDFIEIANLVALRCQTQRIDLTQADNEIDLLKKCSKRDFAFDRDLSSRKIDHGNFLFRIMQGIRDETLVYVRMHIRRRIPDGIAVALDDMFMEAILSDLELIVRRYQANLMEYGHRPIPLFSLSFAPPVRTVLITVPGAEDRLVSLTGRAGRPLADSADRWKEGLPPALVTIDERDSFVDPFRTYSQLFREAFIGAARDGARRAPLLALAAACEVLVREVILVCMWEEGVSPSAAASQLNQNTKESIFVKVSRMLAPRLGGQWDSGSPGVARDWKTKIADLRNKVVHNGYEPTAGEVQEAFLVVEQLLSQIKRRILERRNLYPYLVMFAYRTELDDLQELRERKFVSHREYFQREGEAEVYRRWSVAVGLQGSSWVPIPVEDVDLIARRDLGGDWDLLAVSMDRLKARRITDMGDVVWAGTKESPTLEQLSRSILGLPAGVEVLMGNLEMRHPLEGDLEDVWTILQDMRVKCSYDARMRK